MEKLLQFVWQHRLGLRADMKTVDGRSVRVLDQGQLNSDAGPDFFNASVIIDGQEWAGNIEIHVRASDWYRHGHQHDRAYDSVILHVVQISDMEVKRTNGSVIPQIVIRCSAEAARRCNYLTSTADAALPCAPLLPKIPGIYVTDWLTSLTFSRMYDKSDHIIDMVEESHGAWEEAAYRMLARALGFGLNSQPFEQLARSLPLAFIRKHGGDADAVEALFFGQAALIPDPLIDEDPYITRLRENYRFLAHKYNLVCTRPAWKMARTRPQNMPWRRIAYLAQFMCYSDGVVADVENARTLEDMRDIFDQLLVGYWEDHYNFTPAGERCARAFSRETVDRLIINFVIPLLLARAVWLRDDDTAQEIPEILSRLAPEDNRITRLFTQAGLKNPSAFTSQAMIQLRREFCEKKKCIYCRFGHRMLSAEIQR